MLVMMNLAPFKTGRAGAGEGARATKATAQLLGNECPAGLAFES